MDRENRYSDIGSRLGILPGMVFGYFLGEAFVDYIPLLTEAPRAIQRGVYASTIFFGGTFGHSLGWLVGIACGGLVDLVIKNKKD